MRHHHNFHALKNFNLKKYSLDQQDHYFGNFHNSKKNFKKPLNRKKRKIIFAITVSVETIHQKNACPKIDEIASASIISIHDPSINRSEATNEKNSKILFCQPLENAFIETQALCTRVLVKKEEVNCLPCKKNGLTPFLRYALLDNCSTTSLVVLSENKPP